jgi:hypothetical protein
MAKPLLPEDLWGEILSEFRARKIHSIANHNVTILLITVGNLLIDCEGADTSVILDF